MASTNAKQVCKPYTHTQTHTHIGGETEKWVGLNQRQLSCLGEHLIMSGSIFGCQNWEGVVAKDTDKYPTMHRTAIHIKEVSMPKCQ